MAHLTASSLRLLSLSGPSGRIGRAGPQQQPPQQLSPSSTKMPRTPRKLRKRPPNRVLEAQAQHKLSKSRKTPHQKIVEVEDDGSE